MSLLDCSLSASKVPQRALSPLTLTKDMIVIETTGLDVSQVVEKMLGYIRGAAS